MTFHFLIDAQLPTGLASLFVKSGHQATHVLDLGLLSASDSEIRQRASQDGMIVVTKDQDFAAMRRLSRAAPRVLWLRIGNTTNRALGDRLHPVLKEILAAFSEGEEIVEVR